MEKTMFVRDERRSQEKRATHILCKQKMDNKYQYRRSTRNRQHVETFPKKELALFASSVSEKTSTSQQHAYSSYAQSSLHVTSK